VFRFFPSFCHYLLAQKVTKKVAENKTARFRHRISINLCITVVKDSCSLVSSPLQMTVYKDTAWKTKAATTVALPPNQGK